jgi:hypothetical protein
MTLDHFFYLQMGTIVVPIIGCILIAIFQKE